MTREHWKTVVIAVIAAVLVVIDILPLRTISVRVELPPAAGTVAEKAPAAEAGSSVALALGALSLVVVSLTVVLIVWVVRRSIRHLADARKPNLADVF
jgi:hypothetical protein